MRTGASLARRRRAADVPGPRFAAKTRRFRQENRNARRQAERFFLVEAGKLKKLLRGSGRCERALAELAYFLAFFFAPFLAVFFAAFFFAAFFLATSDPPNKCSGRRLFACRAGAGTLQADRPRKQDNQLTRPPVRGATLRRNKLSSVSRGAHTLLCIAPLDCFNRKQRFHCWINLPIYKIFASTICHFLTKFFCKRSRALVCCERACALHSDAHLARCALAARWNNGRSTRASCRTSCS